MHEFVLGTGHQRSVFEVARLIEQHLVRVEGVPRRIEARGGAICFIADRAEFKGAFDHFRLRIEVEENFRALLQEAIEKHAQFVEVLSDDGKLIKLTVPKAEQAPAREMLDTLKDICDAVGLPEVWRVSGDRYRVDHISPELLFQAMVQYKASDIHLSPGFRPVFRVDNETRVSDMMEPLSSVQIDALIREIASEEYIKEYEQEKQTSFSFHQVGIGYARVSAFIKSGAPHCTFRFLPEKIPSFEALSIPRDTMTKLASLHRGLLLVTGMTGSGKSTTVAALVDWINANRQYHILTIENPIEYVHANKKSIISQRSLGTDVGSFYDAVTGALRHDPDVIVIGEMRDPDTIRSAINAAATGHLVISTLHSNSASEVVNRVVSFFNPIERDLVKLQLRDSLKCVICQRLVPKIGGGRVPALEIMFNDVKAIADGIMEGNTDHIRIGMQQTVSHSFLFEQYLHNLYKEKKISIEHARETATDESVFDQLLMGTYSVPRLDSIRGAH